MYSTKPFYTVDQTNLTLSFSHRSLGWFGTKTQASSRRKRSSHKPEPTNPDIQKLQQLDCHLSRHHTRRAKDVAKYRSLATLYVLILEQLKSWANPAFWKRNIYLALEKKRALQPVGSPTLLSLQFAVQGFHLWNPQLQVLLMSCHKIKYSSPPTLQFEPAGTQPVAWAITSLSSH